MRCAVLGVALALASTATSGWPSTASAAELPYEESRTQDVLAAEELTVEPEPIGKRIAYVKFVRHDVIAEDEVIPVFLNVFHNLTDKDVVERELLLHFGERYSAETAAETQRILRSMGIFALVQVVPVSTGQPDAVGVLVYTRDLWSLRLEQSFQATGGHLDELSLALTELNLAGRAKKLTARFSLLPFEWSGGQVYVDRRVLGSDLYFLESADLIFNRASGAIEGGRATVRLDRPLWDLSERWGFTTQLFFDQRVGRQTSGNQILTFDDPRTPGYDPHPREWDQRRIGAVAAGTLQSGTAVKHRYTGGFGVGDYSTESEYGFEPRDSRRVYPFVAYGGFLPKWRIWHDLATYGLAEDVRLGPTWQGRITTPFKLLGSDQDAVELDLRLSDVEAVGGDGLVEGALGVETSVARGGELGQTFYFRARGATPGTSLGRLVTRWDWYVRRERGGLTDVSLVTLGGDNGLRGYPSQAFYGFGEDLMRGSMEWRTRPLEWHSFHVGGVMFYDTGSVHPRLAESDFHHSAGLGGRFLLPQLNRYVFRLDLGVPLDGTGFMVNLSGGSNQATPMTEEEDEIYENFVGGLPAQPAGPRRILE